MFAVFVNGSEVVGFKEIEYEGEEQTFEIDYVLVEAVPAVLPGHVLKRNLSSGAIYSEEVPPAPPAPEDRIQQLEAENADLTARLGDIELALADIFAGGGI